MKHMIFAAALALGAAVPLAVSAEPVCLQVNRIDHTKVVNPRTIDFYMRGGQIWRNHLRGFCAGLGFEGFEYATSTDDICENLQTIRVLRGGSVCSLGEFERLPSPSPHRRPPSEY
jgi:hypothetical protein